MQFYQKLEHFFYYVKVELTHTVHELWTFTFCREVVANALEEVTRCVQRDLSNYVLDCVVRPHGELGSPHEQLFVHGGADLSYVRDFGHKRIVSQASLEDSPADVDESDQRGESKAARAEQMHREVRYDGVIREHLAPIHRLA